MAAANTYTSFGGKNEINFNSNFIFGLTKSIQSYSKGGLGNIMPDNEGRFNNQIIEQWFASEYSKAILEKIPDISSDILFFEFEFHQFDEDENNKGKFHWSNSNALRGEIDQGGKLGLVKNLIRFTSLISSNRLARSTGSGKNQNTTYMITVRPLLDKRVVLRDGGLNEIGQYQLANGCKERLYDPEPTDDNDFVYCGARVLFHLMKLQGLEENKYKIKDKEYTIEEFIDVLKPSLLKVKNVELYHLKCDSENPNYKQLKLLWPKNKRTGVDGPIYRIVVFKKHICFADPRQGKRKYDFYDCIDCKRNISVTRKIKHEKSCLGIKSRALDKLNAKKKSYPIEEYTISDFDNMNNDFHLIYNLIKNVIVGEKKSVFLQGPGGNGKTFLITKLVNELKTEYGITEIWILTPTGVSALFYSEGCTWQSKFGFTFGGKNSKKRNKTIGYWLDIKHRDEFRNELKNRGWKNYIEPELIIFDECSMIKGVEFDFMSACLSTWFENESDFAGIPILVSSDPGQLEPVRSTGLADLFFVNQKISQIRMHGVNVTLNHPRRLMRMAADPENPTPQEKHEICHQFNIQQHLRNGRVPWDLRNIVKILPERDFLNIIQDPNFIFGNDFVVLPTYKQCEIILGKIFKNHGENVEQIGLDFNGRKLLICIGLKLLICNNQTSKYKHIVNGSACTVLSFEKGYKLGKRKVPPKITVQYEDGNIETIIPGQGFDVLKGNFPLSSFHVRSIHKIQGSTLTGKMYFVSNMNEPGFTKFTTWCGGGMYTLLSRSIDMRLIHFVYIEDQSFDQQINDDICWTYDVTCQVMTKPDSFLSMDICVGKNGEIGILDTRTFSEFIKFPDKSTNESRNGIKYHKDRFCDQNESKFDNLLNLDHETRIEMVFGIEKHVIAFTGPIWTFNGERIDFKSFIERNGGNCDGLVPYRMVNDVMVFSDADEGMDNVGMNLYSWLFRVFDTFIQEFERVEELKNVERAKGSGKKVEWKYPELKYFYYNKMTIVGFNNLGYDDRFMIQELIKTKTNYRPTFIKASGSILKQINIVYDTADGLSRILCSSFDLMQVCGPGSLSAHIKSRVLKDIDHSEKFMTLHSKLWITGISPYGTHILDRDDEYHIEEVISLWQNADDSEKIDELKKWFLEESLKRTLQCGTFKPNKDEQTTYKNKALNNAFRCMRAGKRDEKVLANLENRAKKGCVPLKLYTRMNIEEYRKNKVINLIDYMLDENSELDFTKVFFPREIDEAKKMFDELGLDYFKEYPLHEKIEEYGINDVDLNELLLRSIDNSLAYEFGRETDLATGVFEDSWNGLGLSILNFKTTSEICIHISMRNLPEECYISDAKDYPEYICPKYPVVNTGIVDLVRGICGGKVQARMFYYKSSDGGVLDYKIGRAHV